MEHFYGSQKSEKVQECEVLSVKNISLESLNLYENRLIFT